MKPRIAVVVGSTRPGRRGEQIGHRVHENAIARDDLDAVLVDDADQAVRDPSGYLVWFTAHDPN